MKPIHIALILFVAILVGIFVGTFTSNSESGDFETAFSNPNHEFRITGTLVTDIDFGGNLDDSENGAQLFQVNKAVDFDPVKNLTVFRMRDKNGNIREVRYNQPPPANLERPGEISIVGKANGDYFQANHVQIKCPSKYNEQSHLTEETPAS